MTDALSIDTIKARQDVLQEEYSVASQAFYDAKGKLHEKKAALCAFNDKYGRVIAMMEED
jgi:hypothetical protein